MNNNSDKGVTGAAKTVTGILGNTVSGVSNTVGGVVGMGPSFPSPLTAERRVSLQVSQQLIFEPTGGATRGLGETVNGLTGGVARPVGDGLANVGTGVENGLSDVAKGSRDAGNWKK
jgi:hypothetical protein